MEGQFGTLNRNIFFRLSDGEEEKRIITMDKTEL